MKIKKSVVPEDSLVGEYLPADYVDAYGMDPARAKKVALKIAPDDVMAAFWTGGPAWVGALFRLRNFLVRFVGLKDSKKNDPGEFGKFIRGEVGSVRGFMTIAAKNDRETVLLLTDTHLEAYMSVYVRDAAGYAEAGGGSAGAEVLVITLVHFKNRLGRVYFFVIRPFHAIVAKSMLRHAVNQVINTKR